MIISVFNCSEGQVTDAAMQKAIRAVNMQIERDFEPYWSFGATLRLEGHTQQPKGARRPYSPADMRGDAVLYLWDHVPRDYQGAHDRDFGGVPYGVVGLDLTAELGDRWEATLSHEALELIADPESNLFVQGPDPQRPEHDVFHWFEMCDAVQDQWYTIDDIPVSDFVLPLYFTRKAEKGARNNFLGDDRHREPLQSFGVSAGGYIGYYNPAGHKTETYDADNATAKKRQATKSKYEFGRRQRRLRAVK